jgi:hypothetical protein
MVDILEVPVQVPAAVKNTIRNISDTPYNTTEMSPIAVPPQ